MFSRRANYQKLRTNLRLVVQRLKLLEKKKTEMALKSRKEIADYIAAGKEDRARIRVEHIVREDYYVEALEILELFCDLLLARFGLIETMEAVDDGLREAISSIIWATPRLQGEIPEFAIVSKQMTAKYSPEFADACRRNEEGQVNPKLEHKLSVHAPPKALIENYMIEIAKTYNVPFTPDEAALMDEPSGSVPSASNLIDLGADSGFSKEGDYPGIPVLPAVPGGHDNYPPPLPNAPPGGSPYPPPPGASNYPPPGPPGGSHYPPPPGGYPPQRPHNDVNAPAWTNQGSTGTGSMNSDGSITIKLPAYNGPRHPVPNQAPSGPPPAYSAGPPGPPGLVLPPPPSGPQDTLPELPTVPTPSGSFRNQPGVNSAGGEDVDFDDLTRRFEELKKKS